MGTQGSPAPWGRDSGEMRPQWGLRVLPGGPSPLSSLHQLPSLWAPTQTGVWDLQGHPPVRPAERGICWISAPFLQNSLSGLFAALEHPRLPRRSGGAGRDAWSGGEGWVGTALPKLIPCVS